MFSQSAKTILFAVILIVSACESAKLPVTDGYGSNPKLPPPDSSLIPTINIAPAIGWQTGEKPQQQD